MFSRLLQEGLDRSSNPHRSCPLGSSSKCGVSTFLFPKTFQLCSPSSCPKSSFRSHSWGNLPTLHPLVIAPAFQAWVSPLAPPSTPRHSLPKLKQANALFLPRKADQVDISQPRRGKNVLSSTTSTPSFLPFPAGRLAPILQVPRFRQFFCSHDIQAVLAEILPNRILSGRSISHKASQALTYGKSSPLQAR